jgi:hypothetical protein
MAPLVDSGTWLLILSMIVIRSSDITVSLSSRGIRAHSTGWCYSLSLKCPSKVSHVKHLISGISYLEVVETLRGQTLREFFMLIGVCSWREWWKPAPSSFSFLFCSHVVTSLNSLDRWNFILLKNTELYSSKVSLCILSSISFLIIIYNQLFFSSCLSSYIYVYRYIYMYR